MRICVFGAGSVGGYLAAFLARGGADVSVVARGAHLAAIRAKGLTVETPDGSFTVDLPASDDPEAPSGRQSEIRVANPFCRGVVQNEGVVLVQWGCRPWEP